MKKSFIFIWIFILAPLIAASSIQNKPDEKPKNSIETSGGKMTQPKKTKTRNSDKAILGNRGWIGSTYPSFSLTEEETIYLENLARDTWNSLNYLWEPSTGLPYDNIHKGENTSVTNIGMFFAATSGAYVMGYISKDEAVSRLRLALTSMNKMKRWHGFSQSWNSVRTLQPSKDDYWVSTLDTGNMAGGLLVAKHTFPELSKDIDRYLREIDWNWMYDSGLKKLLGGYITNTDLFAGPLTLLGGDPRLSCFLAIAMGKVDLKSWNSLDRSFEERCAQKYLTPGWQGGGLFMQYISGLFINEWASFLNRSAANFAYAQILYAQEKNYPVWGWSASDSPKDGYLGWGHLKDEVVTPHACVLAVAHYPHQAIRNLKTLELMGARAPYSVNGEPKNFGFRDAIDIQTKEITDNYLYLDQGMLFLSLVDFLRGNALRNATESEPAIRKTKLKIRDYAPDHPKEFSEILRERDKNPGEKSIKEIPLS